MTDTETGTISEQAAEADFDPAGVAARRAGVVAGNRGQLSGRSGGSER